MRNDEFLELLQARGLHVQLFMPAPVKKAGRHATNATPFYDLVVQRGAVTGRERIARFEMTEHTVNRIAREMGVRL